MKKKVKEMPPEKYPLERMGKPDKDLTKIINEIESEDENYPDHPANLSLSDDEKELTRVYDQAAVDAIIRREHLRMFDAYQHFLFYITQSEIEKADLWGGNLTTHLISKLNGLRNRISPGCNSPEVVVRWIQEITLHNQEPLIDFILKHHAGTKDKTKWGREL